MLSPLGGCCGRSGTRQSSARMKIERKPGDIGYGWCAETLGEFRYVTEGPKLLASFATMIVARTAS